MDLATIIGLAGAFAFTIYGMLLGGPMSMYVDVPSILMVFMASPLIAMSKFSLGQFLSCGKMAVKAFMFKSDKPEDLIEKAVQMADAARKGGFLALEEAEVPNAFMKKGVDMLVDGHDADVVRSTLEKDIVLTEERHEIGIQIWKQIGDIGPAMGMIGTLVGLVAMLANMSDPKSIGPAMAVALLTTLYGAVMANMICLPISDKLALRNKEESTNRKLILDAILAIQDGQNPRVIESLLRNYLAESKRVIKTTE